MNKNEQILTDALKAVNELLADWPTMRALSSVGAEKATANKVAARKIVADALDSVARASFVAQHHSVRRPEDEDANYRRDMIDAGRGHLLR